MAAAETLKNTVEQFTTASNVAFKDQSILTTSANLVYSPVKSLDIGLEIYYARLGIQGRVYDASRPNSGITVASSDTFLTRLRIQRDF